jgi:cytochrome bd-type quinol oxidase subunit 2
MQALAQWLAGSPVSEAIQRTLWLIPLLQTVHILAIAMVLSSVAMIGLRILGVGRSQSLAQVARRFLPWMWAGLALLALTGILLIIGEPKRALPNPAFQLKMLMVAVAVVGILVFQASLRRKTALWSDNPHPRAVSVMWVVGAFLLWCAIAVAGRWIAYMNLA